MGSAPGADRHDRGGIGEGAVRMDESAATTPTAAVADTVDVTRIMQMIPHRYPFLLIDRVVDIVAGGSDGRGAGCCRGYIRRDDPRRVMAHIHPTAIVEPGARLGAGVSVGAYSTIGPEVELGDGVTVAGHVAIAGRTRVGARCRI